jgi:hypothetical protein
MSELSRVAVLDALDAVYGNVTAVAGGLGEPDLMRPSRCAGWAVADFAATLAVEAAVHYLDLTVALPGSPAPEPASLALVRRVLDGLLGVPVPASWDDVTAALKGTGREPLTEADRRALGHSAGKFPLFA